MAWNNRPFGALTRHTSNFIMLAKGTTGTYDGWKCGPQQLYKAGAGDWRMWYESIKDDAALTTTVSYATAISALGPWTKYGSNPIMEPSEVWEGPETAPTCVLHDGSQFVMYYHGGGNFGDTGLRRKIGRATSADGLTWTKYASNPVIGTGSTYTVNGAADFAAVRKSATEWVGFARGFDTNDDNVIVRYTSTDGISWTEDTTNYPNLTAGSLTFESDQVYAPGVIYDSTSGEFWMWYVGRNAQVNDELNGIGFAYSTDDGATWTRSPQNPVFQGVAEAASGDVVGDVANVVRDGNTFYVTFGAFNFNSASERSIGIASYTL